MKSFFAVASFAFLLIGCDEVYRPTNPDGSTRSIPSDSDVTRDNTAINVRDRADTSKTPIDQNENQRDIDITANIRERVVETKMSVNAQNIKIITQDGIVTLRGPIESETERKRIEEIAHAVAGSDKVVSQLDVQK